MSIEWHSVSDESFNRKYLYVNKTDTLDVEDEHAKHLLIVLHLPNLLMVYEYSTMN